MILLAIIISYLKQKKTGHFLLGNKNVVEFLLRYPHDTESLLNDDKFVYNLMKVAKNDQFKLIEMFLFVSPAPADTAAKLSAVYRDMAVTEKERAKDLLEAADFCEELARQLVITSCHVESPVAILNAVDNENTPFIDVLIQCDQKMVIAEFVVQQYLQVKILQQHYLKKHLFVI